MKNRDIIAAIEEFAPLSLQESWDNSGWQLGNPDTDCTGVLLCVDVTGKILEEAAQQGCNLVVSHHPLIFKGVKSLTGRNRVERCVADALRRGISVYSSHTATDCAPGGVSWEMARRLKLHDIEGLDPSGLGCIGNLSRPMGCLQLVELVKETFGCQAVRCSQPIDKEITKIGLCGGSAWEFLPEALARGAQAYITADCKLNQFLDYADDIFLIDAGHFETEQLTKDLFYHVISEKFPNFAVRKSNVERNPVHYL